MSIKPTRMKLWRFMNKIASDLASKKIALIVSMLMMAAFCLRIWDIDMRVLHHDESLHAYYSWVLYKGDGYIHNPMMHGPFQFFLTAGLFKFLESVKPSCVWRQL